MLVVVMRLTLRLLNSLMIPYVALIDLPSCLPYIRLFVFQPILRDFREQRDFPSREISPFGNHILYGPQFFFCPSFGRAFWQS